MVLWAVRNARPDARARRARRDTYAVVDDPRCRERLAVLQQVEERSAGLEADDALRADDMLNVVPRLQRERPAHPQPKVAYVHDPAVDEHRRQKPTRAQREQLSRVSLSAHT